MQARVLGGAEDVTVEERVWVIAEVTHPRFCEVPTADEMNNAVTSVVKGSITLWDGEVFIEHMARSSIPEYRERRLKEDTDLRTLGDHRGADGRRRLPLPEAVDLMRESHTRRLPFPRCPRLQGAQRLGLRRFRRLSDLPHRVGTAQWSQQVLSSLPRPPHPVRRDEVGP